MEQGQPVRHCSCCSWFTYRQKSMLHLTVHELWIQLEIDSTLRTPITDTKENKNQRKRMGGRKVCKLCRLYTLWCLIALCATSSWYLGKITVFQVEPVNCTFCWVQTEAFKSSQVDFICITQYHKLHIYFNILCCILNSNKEKTL